VSWDQGRLVEASFTGPKATHLKVRYNVAVHDLDIGEDGTARLAG
jgi:hypothetical protein